MIKATERMASKSVTKTLYRALLEYCKFFDQYTGAKALIVPQRCDYQSNAQSLFSLNLRQILGTKEYYTPGTSNVPLVQLLKRTFSDKAPQLALSDRSNQTSVGIGERLDSGFLALKYLSRLAVHAREMGQGSPHLDEEISDKKLNVSIAESLESGVYLIAHPLLQGIFSRSVILLAEHSSKGALGYIINKLSKESVPSAFNVAKDSTSVSSEDLKKCFPKNIVRVGGPVSSVQVLHKYSSLGGALLSYNNSRVRIGVDLALAVDKINANKADPEKFVYISGSSSWGSGQLEKEIRSGSWIVVRAPLDLALTYEQCLWQQMLLGLGGEYAKFAQLPTASPFGEDEEDY